MKPRNWTHTILITMTAAAAIGCGNEARDRIEDIINQNEAGAAAQQAVLEGFEAELLEELQSRWGATEENGCPDAGPRPEVPGRLLAQVSPEADAERDEVYAQRRLWRVEDSKQNRCECVQKTATEARDEAQNLEGITFNEDRERIQRLTDDELTLEALLLANTPIQFGKDQANNRIARWRRVHDGTAEQPGWGVEGGSRQFNFCDSF